MFMPYAVGHSLKAMPGSCGADCGHPGPARSGGDRAGPKDCRAEAGGPVRQHDMESSDVC